MKKLVGGGSDADEKRKDESREPQHASGVITKPGFSPIELDEGNVSEP